MKTIFQKLLRLLGWRKRRLAIIGLGKFDCSPTDLATNKRHMDGFGR